MKRKNCNVCGMGMTESIKHIGAWFCVNCKVTKQLVNGKWKVLEI